MSGRLVIRNVEVEGSTGLDVLIEDGRIATIGPRLHARADEIDGCGGALIPGLVDHHIHLFALAAQADSVALDSARNAGDPAARIASVAALTPPGAWVRATGYHERIAGELDRHALDRLSPRHPLRLQHQTGSLWILNSLALQALDLRAAPEGLERDADGQPTGRLWREDAWLREQLGATTPPLAAIGRALAGFGVTAVTDASVSTDQAGAARLADAVRAGDLSLRLTLMSAGPLEAPPDAAFAVGPVKILLDDHALPPLEQLIETIGRARTWRRPVAVHCVTAGELAVTLAAFGAAGAQSGDRIEHGGVIAAAAIGEIRRLGLTVVTQPAFVEERGDRYLAEVERDEQDDLYRCASLVASGVPVAGSSDAPYATPDPWVGIAAAIARRTQGGRPLGQAEQLRPARALSLYLGDPAQPGGANRWVNVGALADLCLLDAPLRDVLAAPSAGHVRATVQDGRLVWAGAPTPDDRLGPAAPAAMTSGRA